MKIHLINDGKPNFKFRIFIREAFLQWGLFIILPIALMYYLFDITLLGFLYAFLFFIFINSLSLIIFKKDTLDFLSRIGIEKETKTKTSKISNLNLFFALIIDWTIIISLSIILDRILIKFVFVYTIFLIMLFASMYYFISYWISKTTFGKYLFSIKLNSAKDITLKTILIREIVKFGLGYWLPFIILYYILNINCYLITLYVFILNLLFLMFYFTKKGKVWWDIALKTEKNTDIKLSKKKLSLWYLCLILFIGFSYSSLLIFNNIDNPSVKKIAGFDFPLKRIEYPNNSKIEPYNKFLSQPQKKPVDYVIDLFDKYDIVVICENIHGEDKQWDFIYSLVSDKRFIDKVGNIFTEYGTLKNQYKVDEYMKSSYADDTLLNKATANLTYYVGKGSFYFFMKNLYHLNQTLPDSLKVKEHFTDYLSQNYLSEAYFDSVNNNKNAALRYRDSLMAQVIIDWYKINKKKCLVITNYRHAFSINKGVKNYIYNERPLGVDVGEAQYIYNIYPERTANVLLHRRSVYNYLWDKSIQNGKWNRAFKNNNNLPVGFDLAGSPFGNDIFDLAQIMRRTRDYKYQDVFTGFVFYVPEEEYSRSSALYEKYAAEEEYKFASNNNMIDTVCAKYLVNRFDDKASRISSSNFWFYDIYDYFDLQIWAFMSIITIIISTFIFIIWIKKSKFNV